MSTSNRRFLPVSIWWFPSENKVSLRRKFTSQVVPSCHPAFWHSDRSGLRQSKRLLFKQQQLLPHISSLKVSPLLTISQEIFFFQPQIKKLPHFPFVTLILRNPVHLTWKRSPKTSASGVGKHLHCGLHQRQDKGAVVMVCHSADQPSTSSIFLPIYLTQKQFLTASKHLGL